MSNAPDPDVTYLSIFCAEQSHADKPWLIASFLPEWHPEVGEAGAWVWQESTGYWRDNRVIKQLRPDVPHFSMSIWPPTLGQL